MLHIYPNSAQMSLEAARHAASLLRSGLDRQSSLRLVAATGASQLDFLEQLCQQPAIDWTRVELFHLDEYVGIGIDHPASFARYIKSRIVEPFGITRYHLLDGTRPPAEMIAEANAAVTAAPLDLAFIGIGENGHLAFNDPPADFVTNDPYLHVELDNACREQQVNEGWFATLADVPTHAISMSVRQILECADLVCVVPGIRKAQAVKSAIEGPVSPQVPASILRTHPRTTVFVDQAAASLLHHS